ncbi:MAG: T9SS type A sorting domain-containing protein [Bacteroidales bacterium]|jgi:hypothetical protein|nr:T9SS type A sorting domain-containing protein [Bacteroidales bacterium]
MKRFIVFTAMCIFGMLSASGQASVWTMMNEQPSNDSVHVWDGVSCSSWEDGNGTQNDPYRIRKPEHLCYLGWLVNNGIGTGASGHTVGRDTWWRLEINIDLNGHQWTPIGNWVSGADYYNFGGHFDGNGHTISNLVVNSNELERIGLFGSTDGGSIANVGVIGNSSITRTAPAPAAPAPHSDPYAGGIVGYAEHTFITNCYSGCNISSVNSTPSFLGGIAGYSTGSIFNCYNAGDISCNFSFTNATAYLGGIVGYTTVKVTVCCNTGDISLSAQWLAGGSGGIAGYSSDSITDCYNMGNIISNHIHGGIAGHGRIVKNCYNAGSLQGGGIMGAAVPYIGTVAVLNCYYLNTCGGNNNNGGVSKTEVFMKTAELVALLGSSFKQDVVPYLNQGYPLLIYRMLIPINIAETRRDPALHVYPNPATTELHIAIDGLPWGAGAQNPVSGIAISDMAGRTVEMEHVASRQNDMVILDVSHLPAGMYMVKIGGQVGKFVKR